MKLDSQSLALAIGRNLRAHRSLLMHELKIHDAIEEAICEAGIPYIREHRLSERDRLDFWFPSSGTAMEVKKGKASLQDLRQVARYLEHKEVNACIFVALRFADETPETLMGKPLQLLPIWKYLL